MRSIDTGALPGPEPRGVCSGTGSRDVLVFGSIAPQLDAGRAKRQAVRGPGAGCYRERRPASCTRATVRSLLAYGSEAAFEPWSYAILHFAMMCATGNVVHDIEKYGLAEETGEMTLQDAISALVEARQGGLAPLGAADLLANWKTARADYAEGGTDVLHENLCHISFLQITA
jgi:hypothetical protein